MNIFFKKKVINITDIIPVVIHSATKAATPKEVAAYLSSVLSHWITQVL
jgi:hypothetical protein